MRIMLCDSVGGTVFQAQRKMGTLCMSEMLRGLRSFQASKSARALFSRSKGLLGGRVGVNPLIGIDS